MDYFNEYAEEHWNAKADPYEDKDGNKVRLPKELATKREQKPGKRSNHRHGLTTSVSWEVVESVWIVDWDWLLWWFYFSQFWVQ